MKSLLLLLFSIGTLCAGDAVILPTPTPPTAATSLYNLITNEVTSAHAAQWLDVSINPTYAKDLASHWGLDVNLTHPTGSYTSVGVSLMALNGNYYSGTFGVSFQPTLNLSGLAVRPFVTTGAYVPFTVGNTPAGSAGANTSVAASVATGMEVLLWKKTDGSMEISGYGEMKYVSTLPGIQIWGGGLKVGIKF